MNKYNTKRKGVTVRIVETGEVFNSMQACADHLGVDVRWLANVVRGEHGLRTIHGYHVVPITDTRTIMDIDQTEYRGRPGTRVRIVETGEVFNSILDCAEAIHGSAGSIHDALHNNRNRTTYQGLHFEFAD